MDWKRLRDWWHMETPAEYNAKRYSMAGKVADELEASGWTVDRQARIGGYQPRVVASRGDERLIIDVQHGAGALHFGNFGWVAGVANLASKLDGGKPYRAVLVTDQPATNEAVNTARDFGAELLCLSDLSALTTPTVTSSPVPLPGQ